MASKFRRLSFSLILIALLGVTLAATDCAHKKVAEVPAKNSKPNTKTETASAADDLSIKLVPAAAVAMATTTTTLPKAKAPEFSPPSLENLALVYLKAQSLESDSPVESCQMYLGLAQEKKFPLATLSLLRAHLICDHPEKITALPNDLVSDFPWLEELDVIRQIREATLQKNAARLASALLRESQLSDRIPEKVDLLLNAQTQAIQALKDSKNNKSEQKLLADIQSRLYRLAARYIPNPSREDYYHVGIDWIYQRQFAKGRKYLHSIIKDKKFSNDEKYLARRAIRNSFKTEQNLDEYLKQATQFARWCEKSASPQRAHEATLILARAQWTQGKNQLARKTLNHAEKIFKGKVPLDEVYYVRGKMFEEEHKYAKAIQSLTLAASEAKANSPNRDRILFSKAWVLLKSKKNKEAAESFKTYRDSTLDPFEKNKASFWYARTLKKSGNKTDSQKEFQNLAQNDPVGFYGLVSYRELGQQMPALSETGIITDTGPRPRPRGVKEKDHEMIQALTLVHEDDLLGSFLDGKTQELKAAKNLDQAQWLYYLKAYAQAGLYSPLFVQLGTLPAEMKSQLLLQNPDLLFPRRYVDLVQTWGQKFKVSPELMLSIIRQESSFNPFARSPADAFGLMQLLPSVAKDRVARVKIPVHHFEDLYKPEVNIPYGAALLSDLQKKYRGQFVLTVASYNANEKAIGNWLRTRLKEDPLEFIEDVPYEETRAYIKLVLRNFIFYSRLATPREALSFPDHCLSDLHSFKVSTR
jgi:soluble lytic murein transglycosylase